MGIDFSSPPVVEMTSRGYFLSWNLNRTHVNLRIKVMSLKSPFEGGRGDNPSVLKMSILIYLSLIDDLKAKVVGVPL